MALQQKYFMQEWNSIPTPVTESEKNSACFDCSICLEFASDPVVTLCGHLYCWPCIYKWFDSQRASLNDFPQCPVCKAEISEKTMVPLYGRGKSISESESGKVIPPRPPACGIKGLTGIINRENRFTSHDSGYESDSSPSLFNLTGTATMDLSQPVVGMFGEMVYARVFGNSQSLYSYPNSYHSMGSSTPRMRRHESEADKSLNRVSFFLLCCFLWCLLLF